MIEEEVKWWLEILEANMLDNEYRVSTDSETHFKIAALRRTIERNEQLEEVLSRMNALRNEIGEIIGKAL